MARSREARARRAQRRDKYADEVLGRISDSTRVRVKGMAWDNELAVLLPNHLTPSERAVFAKAIAGMDKVELRVRIERHIEDFTAYLYMVAREPSLKYQPRDPEMHKLLKASSRQEHISANGGKIVQPAAGLAGPATRYDTSIEKSTPDLPTHYGVPRAPHDEYNYVDAAGNRVEVHSPTVGHHK